MKKIQGTESNVEKKSELTKDKRVKMPCPVPDRVYRLRSKRGNNNERLRDGFQNIAMN